MAEVIEDIEALFLEHGYHPVTEERTARPSDHTESRPGSDILPPGDLEAFATKIGNPDLGWDEWNNAGMAFWRASGGSEAGRAAFHTWSQQSGKYDHDTTEARWERYEKSPPTQLGVGTLVYLAQQAQPDFRRPSLGPRPEDTHWEEADPHAAGRTEAREHAESSAEPAGSRPREKHARAKGNGLDNAEAVILDPTDPYKSAAVFLERHCSHKDGRTLQRHRGSFYAYTNTHYREMQVEEIRRGLYLFLDGAQVWRTAGKKTKGEEPAFELAPFKPNRNHVHDLVDTVQARAGIDDQLAMPCWLGKADPQGTVIPMANGLLELATGKLLPHSPRYFQSYSLSFDYAPKAPEPTEWLRFLASLWPDDDEARDTLQEIMGLLLTDDTSHHKLFMLSVLYAQWRTWCGDQGRDRPGTVQAFGTALRAALPHLKVTQHRDPPDDKLDRFYLGVRLRKEADL